MKKSVFLLLLFSITVSAVAQAGQYRITPPRDARKRPPPSNYRESRLEIINGDDRGYAIDVDYRRNRMELVQRSRGDVYLAANSRITLVFDDDDNWQILGDNDSLDIEIRSGRTSTLRLDTRMNKRQTGLFGTVENGNRRYSKQLFRYADRSSRPDGNRHLSQSPPPPAPITRPPLALPGPQYRHGSPEPSKGAAVGAVVGSVIGGMLDKNNR